MIEEQIKFNKGQELFDALSPWGDGASFDGFIFRGHSQDNYQLIPSALRVDNADFFWKVCGLCKPIKDQWNWEYWQIKAEYTILRSFYRLADQQGLDVPISEKLRSNLAQSWDSSGDLIYESEGWLPPYLLEAAALAQHYGIPTRLLDWTYDPYIALYFAFRGAINKQGNMVIWCINKDYLSFLKPTVNRVNINFITPHYSKNPNLNAQKGLFTHWPTQRLPDIQEIQHAHVNGFKITDRAPLNELVMKSINDDENLKVKFFKKITIPCFEAKEGCRLLDRLGYNAARVFPGYNGVAKQLLQRNKYC